MPTVFFAFRDAPDRRAALQTPASLDRYRLFGLDQVRARGATVRHNLERDGRPPVPARLVAAGVNRLLRLAGGYGGDFATVLSSLRVANEADVVFSTSDTVGLPLVLLKRARLLRTPVVYAAIGLPERLVQLRSATMRRLYTQALGRADTIVAYSEAEAERLRAWLGNGGSPVRFVPFGVDVHEFSPAHDSEPEYDVVSVGADPHRDVELLIAVASRQQRLRVHIVTTAARAGALGTLPANVSVETDVSLEHVRGRLARARVVALPVRRNSYSGATTVLLQAMAMAKPVVVSRTDAIATGYGLEDGVNCRLVTPGDVAAFERAVLETVAGADAAVSLGLRARELIERNFSWERYTNTLWEILSVAASAAPAPPRR
jgi:glycosyltransferase involved in cell wall biosynthesis